MGIHTTVQYTRPGMPCDKYDTKMSEEIETSSINKEEEEEEVILYMYTWRTFLYLVALHTPSSTIICPFNLLDYVPT